MNQKRRLYAALVAAGGFAVIGLGVFACSSSGDDAASTYNPGGDDASGSDVTTGGGDEGGQVTALCESLGGYAAVQQLAQATVTTLSQDCRIGPYFTSLSADDQQHHSDCFETFLAASAQCVDNAGGKITYAGSKDSRGVLCKPIPQAHQALGLTRDDYKAFQEDAVAALNAKNVAPELRNAVIGIFNGQPGVYNANKTGDAKCSAATCDKCVAVPDAGTDADADAGTPSDSGSDADAGDGA